MTMHCLLQSQKTLFSAVLLTLLCLGSAPSAAASSSILALESCPVGGAQGKFFQQSDAEPDESDDESDEEEDPDC